MKISVVIPVYNAEVYIERTIKSIILQNIEEMEIIIVNDGSNDKTIKIIQKYAKVDKRIKIISQLNNGVSSARNKGIENATGDYIFFMDADDILVEDTLNDLLYNAEKNKADILIGDIKIIKNEKKIKIDNESIKLKYFSKKEVIQNFLRDTSEFNSYSACAKLYSKKIYAHLKFEEKRNSNEDRYYFFQAICKSKLIVYENRIVYLYEKHKNSLSTSKVDIRILDNIYFADKIFEYVNKKERWALNFAIYNQILTYMMVYRNFYRDKDAIKKYKYELINLRKKILDFSYNDELSISKKIELFIIRYFNYLYYFIIKVFDKIKNLVG